jgi:hypothetical protein
LNFLANSEKKLKKSNSTLGSWISFKAGLKTLFIVTEVDPTHINAKQQNWEVRHQVVYEEAYNNATKDRIHCVASKNKIVSKH